MSQKPSFKYASCEVCNKHIMIQEDAPKPAWFHTPSPDYEMPKHIAIPKEDSICFNQQINEIK